MKYITVLFKKHKKHVPAALRGPFIGEMRRYGIMIFLSAWIFQGILIMNWREAVVKVGFTAVFAAAFWSLGMAIVPAVLIAHTLNFAFNGQLYAMYTHMGATHVTARHFLEETERASRQCRRRSYIDAAIAYGSLSRGCFKSTSDIDLRLVPAGSEWSWWRAVFYALWMRCEAFVRHYPLDLYVYSGPVCARRMRSDELPIMLAERDGCMRSIYPKRVEFNEFVKLFTEQNL